MTLIPSLIRSGCAAAVLLIAGPLLAQDGVGPTTPAPRDSLRNRISTGVYFVTQSWSQEQRFQRPYYVNVPQHEPDDKLPVLIFLHGNGGNAKGAMQGFLNRNREIAEQFVTVFPDGYRQSWNIVSERSQADDRAFIESIVETLTRFENIQSGNVSVMGSSNGAALVNQLAIETKLPAIRNFISAVSPLNRFQHDGKNFKAKGEDNNYQTTVVPMSGKRLLNISGVDDRIVPYRGGPSRAIPAKNGKLAFLDAEESTFLWARQMGYKGEQLTEPSQVSGRLEIFRYPGGRVIHIKVNGEGHGATRAVSERLLLQFLGKRPLDK